MPNTTDNPTKKEEKDEEGEGEEIKDKVGEATIDASKPPEINDHCKIRWRDGEQVLLARVVERRPLLSVSHRRNKKRKGIFSAADLESLKAEEIEYYVHYVDHDRRLDEWVTIDKFQLDTIKRAEQILNDKSTDGDNKARPSRRRSNTNTVSNKSSQESSSFSLTGGNWHGNSGDPSLAELVRQAICCVFNVKFLYMVL